MHPERGAAGPVAHSKQGARSKPDSCSWPGIPPLSNPTHHHGQPLTAFLLVTLVEAVRQPVTLPGARDAPPVAAHEVTWDVALVGEVVPREQLALCERENRWSESKHSGHSPGLRPGLAGKTDIQPRGKLHQLS